LCFWGFKQNKFTLLPIAHGVFLYTLQIVETIVMKGISQPSATINKGKILLENIPLSGSSPGRGCVAQ
jgi:hypothetical protein